MTVLTDSPRQTFEHYRVIGLPNTVVLDHEGRLAPQFRSPITKARLAAAVRRAAE